MSGAVYGKTDRGLPVPLLTQLLAFSVQLSVFLVINWLHVRHHYRLPISDTILWSVLLPITWLIHTLISYHYSNNRLHAILQSLLQTLVSYMVVVAIMLFFHRWTGGSF